MSPILEARGLSKRFGESVALAGLDLTAQRGEVSCILGPNGAGKTTFIRMVATLLRPDSGELVVAGIDALRQPGRVRRAIGLAGQAAAVEGAMTGRENLELVGRLFGLDRRRAQAGAAAVLEQLSLDEVGDRLVRTYSGGTRRKLDLGVSLVGEPELLLLDEPTTGLDPRSRNELWGCIRALVANGTSVVLTTQYLDEADQLADKIAIVDRGHVIAEGSPQQLKARTGLEVIEVQLSSEADLARTVAALSPLGCHLPRVDAPNRRVTVPVQHGAARLVDAVRVVDSLGVAAPEIGLRRPSLDEVFLALTGGSEEDTPLPDVATEPVAIARRSRFRRAA